MNLRDILDDDTLPDEKLDKVDGIEIEDIAELFDVPEEQVTFYHTGPAFKVEKDEFDNFGIRNPLPILSKLGFSVHEEGTTEDGMEYRHFEQV